MTLRVLNLLNNHELNLQPFSIQSFTTGVVTDPTFLYLATDHGSGALSLSFRVIHSFILLNLYYVDVEHQLVQMIRLPHQIELFCGDEIHGCRLRRTKSIS